MKFRELEMKLQKIGWQIAFYSLLNSAFLFLVRFYFRNLTITIGLALAAFWAYLALRELKREIDIKGFFFQGNNRKIKRIIFDYDSQHEDGPVDCEHGAIGEQPKTMR